MDKRNRYREYIAILILSTMVWYTRSTMLCEIDDLVTSSFAGWLALIVCFFGLLLFLSDKDNTSTLSGFMIGYVIWMIVDLYVLGNKGGGLADGFRVCFGPMSFLLFYSLAKYSFRVDVYCFVFFLIIFCIASYYNIVNVQKILFFSNTEYALSNLVYWSLCSFPFVFLVPKRWVQIICFGILFIIVIITGKRSALLSISLIALIWYLSFQKETNSKVKTFAIFGLVISTLLYMSTSYLANFSNFLFGKVISVVQDQGSGRIPIYHDVLSSMNSFNIFEYIVGRGMGKITLSGHTNAHNDALQMLYEYGLVGLILYIVLFVKLLKRCRLVREYDAELYMGYVSCFIIFVVLGLVSNLVVFFSYFSFLCIYWGMAEGRMHREHII